MISKFQFIYYFVFSFFFFTNYLCGDVPAPSAVITAENHSNLHPEDLKFVFVNEPFPFESNPIMPDLPKPWQDGRVFTIPQGRCYGVDGVAITQDNLLLLEASFQWQAPPHSITKKQSLPTPEYYDANVAEIGALASVNYYHWMIDVLPRIGLIEEAGLTPDFYHTLYPDQSFRKETLDILGIGLNKIIPAEENLHIQARTLIVPTIVSMPLSTRVKHRKILCVPFHSIEFLRKRFLLEQPQESNRRLYISRKFARGRRILNEEEVMAVLQSYGFEYILLENMSVVEQAKLFASASVIVGPHGAGFTNMVFCKKGTKILELTPMAPWFWSFCFWSISQQLNLEHTYLLCKDKHNTSDMTVNLEDLEAIINQYLLDLVQF